MDTENEQNVEETQDEETKAEESQTETTEAEETQDEESTLAEEALSEASDEKAEEKVDPKDAVIGDFRKQLRESELMVAELKGQVETLKPKPKEPEKEVIKSPFDLAAEKAEARAKEDGLTADDAEVTFTPKLLREQAAFDKEQRETQAVTQTEKQTQDDFNKAFVTAGETMDAKAMGEGLDFNTIIEFSGDLVTKQDHTWLATKSKDWPDFCKRLYKFAIDAINEAGGENAKDLQAKIEAHSQVKKETKKPEKKEVPTKEEIIEKASTVAEAHLNAIANA